MDNPGFAEPLRIDRSDGGRALTNCLGRGRFQAFADRFPERASRASLGFVSFTLHNISTEIGWDGNPRVLRPEEGFSKHDAADIRAFSRSDRRLSIELDPLSHLGERSHAVRDTKYLPSHLDGQLQKSGKESAANYEVIWSVEFEKQDFAWFQCF